ncbi:alpha/beta fold hydrolase [Alteribacillus sp. YIM 98480]|uniref:alpha/beta fold hydrolase n=1 Tax=Alteribacillus sp. YIM 98480 TaxID=2606599 RepID=UPI00131E174F|nr:alpha/beta hydrolase [Alteribacillus sp. YIM 98480]
MGEYLTTKSGRTLYIHDTPGGDRGTIIAAHGLTGNHKQLHYYQEAFLENYRFISYDILGRGNSDKADPDTSIYTHTDDFIDLIKTLKIERPILMGYSMGAYICAITASRLSNVEALILLDGAGEANETTRDLVIPSLSRLEKSYSSQEAYVKETKNLYQNLNIHWDSKLEEIARYEVKQDGSQWTHKSDYALTKQDFESLYSFDPRTVCSSISCETLLIIAAGAMKNNKALFKEEAFNDTKKHISRLQTERTPVNHYELVFNKQPKVLEHIQHFLANGGVKS